MVDDFVRRTTADGRRSDSRTSGCAVIRIRAQNCRAASAATSACSWLSVKNLSRTARADRTVRTVKTRTKSSHNSSYGQIRSASSCPGHRSARRIIGDESCSVVDISRRAVLIDVTAFILQRPATMSRLAAVVFVPPPYPTFANSGQRRLWPSMLKPDAKKDRTRWASASHRGCIL